MPFQFLPNSTDLARHLPSPRALRPWLLGSLLLSSVFTLSAYGVAELAPVVPPERNVKRSELPTPDLGSTVASGPFWQDTLLRRGDTLGSALHRLNANEPSLLRFVRSDATARELLELQAGRLLKARIDESGKVQSISYLHSSGKRILVQRTGNDWSAESQTPTPFISQRLINGLIKDDFLASFAAAALTPETLRQLDEIKQEYGGERGIPTGQAFSLVIETASVDGETLRPPRLLAARLPGNGRLIEVFLHHQGETGSYYFSDGRAALPAFLSVPVDHAAISSSFAMRLHPVLGVWLQHKGTDFAAPAGSNIYSAAAGKVSRIGTEAGYGNFVEVEHANGMSTLYGHMQGFAAGLKTGQTVQQGDVIGYVGSTGRSTGPHLHYEIRRNGIALNPDNTRLPSLPALGGQNLQAFRQQLPALLTQLQTASQTALALNHPARFE